MILPLVTTVVTDSNTPSQIRAVASLAILYAFRMMGLFMVLPVLSLYGEDYAGSSPALLGLALGAYGASQAVLQIPFGLLSDKLGRKPVIAAGLVIFAVGSVVAATADSVYGLILGRFLQGGGAIASAIMALVADLTSDSNRTKAMATIGASIGLSFSIALIAGPYVSSFGGLSAVFWLTAIFAVIGLFILFVVVPQPTAKQFHDQGNSREMLIRVISHNNLLRLNLGIFVLHFVLMASFVVVPSLLLNVGGIAGESHWQVYLPLLGGAFLLMLPFMVVGEKRGQLKRVFLTAVAILCGSQFILNFLHTSYVPLLVCLLLFFMAFNLLEATLPSLLSKLAPAGTRGAANGVYSTSQFLGAFLGGAVGGQLFTHFGLQGVFLACAILSFAWWLFALSMSAPKPLADLRVGLDPARQDLLPTIAKLPGVAEVWYEEAGGAAHLKVDKTLFKPESIAALGL